MAEFDPEVDYYAILQVHPQAHQEVIKRAYHTILGLLKTHPDLGGSHEEAVRINEAYQVLSKTELRAAYDSARQVSREAPVEKPVRTTAESAMRCAPPTPGQSPRSAPTPLQNVYCPKCRSRNRLPATADLRFALCGKCRTSLASAIPVVLGAILPAGDISLTPHLAQTLESRGEVRLVRLQLPANHQLRCFQCGYGWTLVPGAHLPAECPHCHSRRWGNFRLFRCRRCGHRFTSADLLNWPYWLYPCCPACHQSRWHAGCERHPLRWLFNRLARWMA